MFTMIGLRHGSLGAAWLHGRLAEPLADQADSLTSAVLAPKVADAGSTRAAGPPVEVAAQVVGSANLPPFVSSRIPYRSSTSFVEFVMFSIVHVIRDLVLTENFVLFWSVHSIAVTQCVSCQKEQN